MTRQLVFSFVLLGALFTAACGDDDPVVPSDAGVVVDGGPDGGPRDGGSPDGGSNVDAIVESFGRFTAAPTHAVLSAPGVVLLGAELTTFDGDAFDLDERGIVTRGGLFALDTATGEVRSYGTADGLPRGDGIPEGTPSPIFDLDWLDEGRVAVAAMGSHVARIAFAEDGEATVLAATLRRPGTSEDAVVNTAKRVGTELVVGTDRGFVALDPTTLAPLRWLDVVGGPWTRQTVAVDGPALLALVGPEGAPSPDSVVRIEVGATAPALVQLPLERDRPSAVGVARGRGYVTLQTPDDRAELWTLEGADLVLALDVDRLGAASSTPFGVATIAHDATQDLLLLGGRITIGGPVRTGGLAVVATSTTGLPLEGAEAQPAFDRRDPYTQLLPWETNVLHVDELGRWYVAGLKLCSERRAGISGLVRVERIGDERVLVRPIVSGVRDVVRGPGDETWLGLRDENGGFACEGIQVQQGLCRLRADGACLLFTPRVNEGDDVFAPSPGVTAIAFGEDDDEPRLALATARDATFVRIGEVTRALATQLEPGLNLDMTAAAWAGDALWLGSSYAWDDLPGFPDEEKAKINARGPQGLGYLAFSDEGRILEMRRYVRQASDQPRPGHQEIGGLRSSNVRAVLPLDGGRALVGVGLERKSVGGDHRLGELAPTEALGGIDLVQGATVAAIAAPAGIDFSEIVALVRFGETVLALDAANGVFEVDVEARAAERVLEAAWPASERALSLAIDSSGVVAVGTTRGVYVAVDGALERVTTQRTGWVWSMRFVADGVLLAGTDEGLVRVRIEDAVAPPLGPAAFEAREPWPLDLGCNGEEDCACFGDDHCAPELSCVCANPSDCRCEAPRDPCLDAPGSVGCGCAEDTNTCDAGLVCDCSGERCTCQPDAATCTQDCSCATPSGCPDGWTCQGGIAGFSCVMN